MKNWIKNFISDERGAESTEMAVTTVVIAGGAVAGYATLRNSIKDKQDDMVAELGSATVAPSSASPASSG
jgi:Flp pilus assembly pilin Flp